MHSALSSVSALICTDHNAKDWTHYNTQVTNTRRACQYGETGYYREIGASGREGKGERERERRREATVNGVVMRELLKQTKFHNREINE